MMKKLLTIIAIAGLQVIAGCSLEEELLDTPAPSNFIQSADEVEAVLAGAYTSMGDPVYRGHIYRFLFFLPDHLFNTYYKAQSDKFTLNTSDGSAWLLWRNFYGGIRDVNHLMRDMERIELSDEYRKKAMGECLFIRGWTYYELVRLFGGVPLRDKAVDLTVELHQPRATEKETYEQLLADLRAAAVLLPAKSSRPNAERNRANKGAAHAALASAYLTYGVEYDDQEALKLSISYADSVINSGEYALENNFANLWGINNENSTYGEVIWRIAILGDANNRGTNLPKWFTPPTLEGASHGGRGSGDFRVQPWFYNHYANGEWAGDYRMDVTFYQRWPHYSNARETVAYPSVPLTTTSLYYTYPTPYVAKYVDPDGFSFHNHSTDWYVFRLSEMYLIKAEAENELNGPTPLAYEAFNKVRERARLADGTPRTAPADLVSGLTQHEFRMKILDERSLEFLGEGKRWYDLKRIKHSDGRTMYEYMFDDYVPALPQGLPVFNKTTRTWGGGVTYPESLLMDKDGNKLPVDASKFLLLPIPFEEVNNNDNISEADQNPGW